MQQPDICYEVTLTPALGDGRLTLLDVERVRTVLSGCRVILRLASVETWQSGTSEWLGRELAEFEVRFMIDETSSPAGRDFAVSATVARSQLIAVEARRLADGAA